MSKKSGPPAPDYTGAAQAQANASQQLALQDTYANRPDVKTPWGTQTWSSSAGTDPATGKPITNWTQNISLSPAEQQSLDSQQHIQQGRSDAAGTLLGQATQNFQTPMNWDNLPGRANNVQAGMYSPDRSNPNMPNTQGYNSAFSFGGDPNAQPVQSSLNGASGDYRQRAQDAINQLQQPDLDRARSATETQLANQGITKGSEAYDAEMRRVGDNENRAHLMAIDSGRQEASQAFGQDLSSGQFHNQATGQDFNQQLATGNYQNSREAQDFGQGMQNMQFGNTAAEQQFQNQMTKSQLGDQRVNQGLSNRINAGNFNNQNRQQAIAEEAQRRGMTLNELNALLSGQQVNMPQMPSFNNATMGQAPNLLGAAQNQYQSSLDQYNAKAGQIGNTISGAAQIGSMFFSDIRLKEDIHTVGVLPSGLRVVDYRYRGLPGRVVGVIAQEALGVCPEAVALHPSGYLMVDYSKVN